MKKGLLLILVLHFFMNKTIAQSQFNNYRKLPVIEMIGEAERAVDPDEIFIQVVLKDHYQGRKKITIAQQETQLITRLKAEGFEENQIKMGSSKAGYHQVKWLKKDVVTTQHYEIKARDGEQVRKVFELIDAFKIKTAYISKVSHSQIKTLVKELRIEAIKDAKDKGTYLLAAIGQTLGAPLKIKENNPNSVTVRGSRSEARHYYLDGIRLNASNWKQEPENGQIQ